MAQTTISGSTVRKNGGAVAYGNAASTSPITRNVTPAQCANAPSESRLTSYPKQETGAPGASGIKTLISGDFAKLTAGRYVIVQNTAYLAGNANTTLKIPASAYFNFPIAKRESRNTRKIVTAGWNYVTGQPLSTPTVTTDSFGNDEAARPTRAIPGEFVYDKGAPLPTQANYTAES